MKKQNQLAELERERLRQDAKRERQRGLAERERRNQERRAFAELMQRESADRERRTQDRRSVAESFHREMVERERRTLDRRLLAESAAARIADDYVGFWDHDDRKESVDQRATRCAALDAGASSPPCPTLGGSTPPMAKYRQTSAPRSSRATRAEADQPFVWDDIPRQMLQMMSVEDPSVHPAGTPRSGALTPRSGYVGSVDQPRSVASTPRSRLMGSADPPAKARIVTSTSRPGRMGSFDPPDTARSAASNSLHGHVGSMDPPVAARSVASTPRSGLSGSSPPLRAALVQARDLSSGLLPSRHQLSSRSGDTSPREVRTFSRERVTPDRRTMTSRESRVRESSPGARSTRTATEEKYLKILHMMKARSVNGHDMMDFESLR